MEQRAERCACPTTRWFTFSLTIILTVALSLRKTPYWLHSALLQLTFDSPEDVGVQEKQELLFLDIGIVWTQ